MARVAEGLTQENLSASFMFVVFLELKCHVERSSKKSIIKAPYLLCQILTTDILHMKKKVNTLPVTNLISPPLLAYPQDMRVGFFLHRHKRFSVSVLLDGVETWVHSNNSGSMLGLLRKGLPVLLSSSNNPKRKLAFTQEAVWLPKTFGEWHEKDLAATEGFWVGVNTSMPNKILQAAFQAGLLEFADGYTHFKREATRGASRLDACITGEDKAPLWVECKNVTMVEDGVAMFPDACTTRGQKHLMELMDIVQNKERAAMFYVVQRADGKCFAPAEIIDPAYAKLFWQAVEVGVEVYVMRAFVSPAGIYLGEIIPVLSDVGQ